MFRPARTAAQARYALLSVDDPPLWGSGGITSWSLMTSGGENFDKRCRDFRRRQNRGISEILGGRRLKSPDRFPLPSGASNNSEEDWRSGGVQRSGTETK